MKKIYATTDLGLASALKAKNIELLSVQQIERKRVSFIFHNRGDLEMLAANYWSKRFDVDALAYFECMKILKSQVRSILI